MNYSTYPYEGIDISDVGGHLKDRYLHANSEAASRKTNLCLGVVDTTVLGSSLPLIEYGLLRFGPAVSMPFPVGPVGATVESLENVSKRENPYNTEARVRRILSREGLGASLEPR